MCSKPENVIHVLISSVTGNINAGKMLDVRYMLLKNKTEFDCDVWLD